ncbi:hypothetical protein POM88_046991 [Heracleum sosnowskyi]|uniref:Uncharacterized protein n=1 Tax=Heracleum sosnowskyi TaxID=360622 RepID=A0AAD8HAC6_9APIA|nr:hypothetical protein POM88_046991 [Heracleum sosnowskyi]
MLGSVNLTGNRGGTGGRYEKPDTAIGDKPESGRNNLLVEDAEPVDEPHQLEDVSDVSDSIDCSLELPQANSENRDSSPVNWDTDTSEMHPTVAKSSGTEVSTPVVPTVQTAQSLSRSVSVAGRLNLDPSPATTSHLPQSYRNAMMGNQSSASSVGNLAGNNSHHIIEATFKVFARALRQATESDPRRHGLYQGLQLEVQAIGVDDFYGFLLEAIGVNEFLRFH